MQNALAPLLPESLRLRGAQGEQQIMEDGLREPWIYATDEYVPYFRVEPTDARDEEARELRQTIRSILVANSNNPSKKRFVDKSQSYTLKVKYIDKLFGKVSPYFVLITRSPYVLCYRASEVVYENMNMNKKKNEKVKIACQHWKNSMKYVLEDSKEIKNFEIVKFEDIIEKTEDKIEKISSFANLKFDKNMIPSEGDKWPFGGARDNKWYPFRKSVNKKYIKKMSKKDVLIIKRRCGDIAEKLGYSPPTISER